jgi:hypothetical protein
MYVSYLQQRSGFSLVFSLSWFVWLVTCYFTVNLIVCFQVGIPFYLFSLPIFPINCLILIKLYWKWCKDCGSDSSVSKRSTGGWRRIWILDSVVSCLHKAAHGVLSLRWDIIDSSLYRPVSLISCISDIAIPCPRYGASP